LAPTEHVEADIGGDPEQPRSDAGPAFEPVGGPPGAHHRLLHRVLGVEHRPEHPVAVAGEFTAVLLQVLRQGLVTADGADPPRAAPGAPEMVDWGP
jgi:hypothetical protein